MNIYKKKSHCNICAHFSKMSETVYNPHHNGNPGSTDYEAESILCCRDCNEDHGKCKELNGVVYSCKFFKAEAPHD